MELNSKLYRNYKEYKLNVTIYDPWANPEIAMHEYGIEITNECPKGKYDAVIVGVAHNEFKKLNVHSFTKDKSVVYDVKWLLPSDLSDGRL